MAAPSLEKAAPSALALDIQRSSPAQDFVWLFRKRREFFSYFAFDAARPIDRWVAFKSLLGFFLFSFMASFLTGGRWISDFVREGMLAFDEMSRHPLFSGSDFTQLRNGLGILAVGLGHFKMLIMPLWHLFDVVGVTASTVLFLPLFGVERKKVSFYSLFFALAYARWFYVLELIPGIGSWLASIAVPLLSIYVVKWVSGLSFWRAFMASAVLYWVSLAALPVLAFIFLGLFFLFL